MNPELITIISQFGPAGLLGVLWVLERRHATLRDRQLSEAHRVLTTRDSELGAMLKVVRDNTRAIAALEETQRHMLRLAQQLDQTLAVCRSRGCSETVERRG